MEHAEMVALIRHGVVETGGIWADLGAGTGHFTRALREVLGPHSTIYAVDRDAKATDAQRAHQTSAPADTTLVVIQADFTRPLRLPPLDGLLMANALHFVRDQQAVLAQLVTYLKPGGRLILVEYDLRDPVRWVPFPVPFDRFIKLAPAAGLQLPTCIAVRRSPSSGIAMYAACATTELAN